jgi:hypothetical protein
MALRVEENLGVHHVFCLASLHIRPGQIKKILPGLQDRGRLIVKIQKRLQIFEVIQPFQLVGRGIRQIDAVFLREPYHHFRFEGAFDMQMQLRLRQIFG